jgi:primary-amine oxidase
MRALRHVVLCCALGQLVSGCTTSVKAADPVTATYPLEPLSAAETKSAFDILLKHFKAEESLPDEPLRFPIVVLDEPPKAFMLGYEQGKSFPRVARAEVLHYPTNRTWNVKVDLRAQRVTSAELAPEGAQPAATSSEFAAADEVVHAYEPWQRAMRMRGVDPDKVYVDIWAPGDEPLPDDVAAALPYGQNTRILRCLSFNRGASPDDYDPTAPQNPYDRPIEGVVVTVDMNARKVIHMTDTDMKPVSVETGNPAGTLRGLTPLGVSEPRGSNITIDGRRVSWMGWSFYAVLHPREGLVLYDVRYDDHGSSRPVAYRLALSELYVPYGLGDPNWSWRSAFDVGEYNAGTLAQTLLPNRDVPANATFLSAVFASDVGPTEDNDTGTYELPNTVALYEQASGIVWTRTDPTNYERDTRFGRELVITWNCWIGNYIYAFDWIFKLDGSIETAVHLTGTTLNRGTDETPEQASPKVGLDDQGTWVSAANHQHFLNFRLDLDVDGPDNHVMEMEVKHLPETGFKNAFGAVTTHLMDEGYRDGDALTQRHWHVASSTAKNKFGSPTSFAIEPGALPVPYSAPDAPSLERASFAKHQLWITQYKDGELYAAGQFPNQAKTVEGLPVYTEPSERVSDVVVWYSTSYTHITRPEDFPVMSSETLRFRLAPRGFFAKNPALDLADQAE